MNEGLAYSEEQIVGVLENSEADVPRWGFACDLASGVTARPP